MNDTTEAKFTSDSEALEAKDTASQAGEHKTNASSVYRHIRGR